MSTLDVGDVRAPWTYGPVTVTDFVRYQGASSDFNPIHHDTEFAQQAGYPTPFAVGMLSAGMLASYASDWCGPANLRRFAVQFREQAWPGDELTFSATVVAVREDGGDTLVDLDLVCTRPAGGVHLRGSATYVRTAHA
jgi:acyl dehydratase